MFEIFHPGIFVNQEELKVGDFGKVPQVLCGHRIAEAGVVRPASMEPGSRGGLQVGARQP